VVSDQTWRSALLRALVFLSRSERELMAIPLT